MLDIRQQMKAKCITNNYADALHCRNENPILHHKIVDKIRPRAVQPRLHLPPFLKKLSLL